MNPTHWLPLTAEVSSHNLAFAFSCKGVPLSTLELEHYMSPKSKWRQSVSISHPCGIIEVAIVLGVERGQSLVTGHELAMEEREEKRDESAADKTSINSGFNYYRGQSRS